MVNLIRNGQLETDPWHWLEPAEAGPLPPGDRIAMTLGQFEQHGDALRERGALAGILIDPADDPALLLAVLERSRERIGLIAVHISRFGDGRALSLARLLRERHGFAGELRAVGAVLPDQLADLRRCGFDAFALRAGEDPGVALGRLRPFSEAYQAAPDQPVPLFRRRAAG